MTEWNRNELARHVAMVMPPRVRNAEEWPMGLRAIDPENTHRLCRWDSSARDGRGGWVPGPSVAAVRAQGLAAIASGKPMRMRPNRASNQRELRMLMSRDERVAYRFREPELMKMSYADRAKLKNAYRIVRNRRKALARKALA